MFEQIIDGGGIVTEPYGCGQFQPGTNCWNCSANPGLDIAAPLGRPTRAVGYGTVVSVGTPAWAGPACVVIRSGDVFLLYAHQDTSVVRVGQQVAPGQQVGTIGCRVGPGGTCTGPHMHFQANPASAPDFAADYCAGINPWPYTTSWPGSAPPPPPPPPSPPAPPLVVVVPDLNIPLALLLLGAGALAWSEYKHPGSVHALAHNVRRQAERVTMRAEEALRRR